MPFMENCIYSRIDRNGNEVKIHFSAEPIVFHDKCFMPATLGIGDCKDYFISFDHSIDSDSLNFSHIGMLQGMVPYNRQKRYGAILLSSLFEYMCYLEDLYDIKFSYISGDLKKEFKDIYYRQTGKKLTDFYTKAITHIMPYLPNRKLEIRFYACKLAHTELLGNDIEQAGYFRYIISEYNV